MIHEWKMWLSPYKTLEDVFLMPQYRTYSGIYIWAYSSRFFKEFKMNMENYAWKHNVSLIFQRLLWRIFEAWQDFGEGLNIKRKPNCCFSCRSEKCQGLSISIPEDLAIRHNVCKSEIFKTKHLFSSKHKWTCHHLSMI